MNVRYRHEMVSPAGEVWTIDILDSEFTGTVTTFDCYSPGITFTFDGEGDERTNFVKASSATVTAMVKTTGFETFIGDVVGALEQRFFVKVYRDDVLYWAGLMLQDMIQIPQQAKPYPFEMSFSDGVAVLKDLPYDNAGELYVGRETFIWHLKTLLSKTGIDQLFGTTDQFLATAVNWYDTNHSNATANCPLAYTDADHRAFQKVNNTDNTYEAVKCIEVLESICKTFGIRFMQSGGKYWLISLTITPTADKVRYFTKSGAYSASSATMNYTKSVSLLGIREGSNSVMTFLPALLAMKSLHTHKMSVNVNNILPFLYAFPDLDYICNVEEESTTPADYFQFTGKFDYSGNSTSMQAITMRAVMGFKVKLQGATSTYYLTNNGGTYGTATKWVTAENYYRVTLPIDTTQSTFNSSLAVAWNSPQFPVDGEVYFQVVLLGYERLVGQTWQTYFPPVIPTFTFGFACVNFVLIVKRLEYPYSNVSGGKSEHTATQIVSGTTTPVKASAVIELGDIPFADGPWSYSVGKLKVSTDGTTFIDSTYWSRDKSGTAYRLHKTRLLELMIGQLSPLRVLNAAWLQEDWQPNVIYIYEDRKYIFNGGSYSPDDCVVRGEWLELRNTPTYSLINQTDKTLETDYIEVPEDNGSQSPTDGGMSNSMAESVLNILRSIITPMAVTYLADGITSGSAITSFTTDRITNATLRSGDSIMVIDTMTGQTETFTVSANQAADADSVSVSSKTPSVDLPSGAMVIIAPGEVKRYFNNVPEIVRTTSDPSSAPAAAGNIYINTSTGTIWVANGTASSSNWIQVNNLD